MAAAVSAGNMFCALATMVFNTDLSDSNTEDVMSTTYLSSEPVTRRQALRSVEADQWIEAERVEIKSLLENDVFREVVLPKERKAIRCKWIYKRKRNALGEVERYKDRLVAQGFSQIEELDYNETYSPVARFTSI